MKKFIMGLMSAIIIIIVVLALVGGYFGFVPGVSSLFGSNKPKDLEIKSSQQDLESAVSKTGIGFSYMSSTGAPQGAIKFEGKTNINQSFTGAELTALLENDKWEYNFLQNTQIKINADGSEELSGVLIIDRIPGFLIARGYPESIVSKAHDALKYIPTNPTFYVKLDAGWQNNILSMDVQEAQIGKLSAPKDWLTNNKSAITGAVQNHVLSVPNLKIDSLRFKDGKMEYNGTFPSGIIWSK